MGIFLTGGSKKKTIVSLEPFSAIRGNHTVESTGVIDRLPHYFTAAENADRALRELQTWHNGISNKILVGIGGCTNLDIIAQMKLGGGILMDKNRGQAAFWRELLEEVKHSPTRHEFVENMIAKGMVTRLHPFEPDQEKEQLGQYREENARQLRQQLQNKMSWLGTDNYYKHIRTLAEKDRFGLVSLDLFSDTKAVKAIRDKLVELNEHSAEQDGTSKNGLKVEVLYLSNLRDVISYAKTNHHRGIGFYGEAIASNAEDVLKSHIDILCDAKTQIVEADRDGICSYTCRVIPARQYLGHGKPETSLSI